MSYARSRVMGVLLLCGAHAAGAADRATVSAPGNAETSVPPDFVRLTALIQERGTRIEDMLRSLTARGEEIEKKIKPLKASSISIGDPEVIPIQAEMRRQISAAISRLKAIKQGQEGEEAFVQVRVTAEFPLTGDLRARGLAAAILRRQVAETLKQPAKEDEEASSDGDSEGNMLRMATGDSTKPGTVVAFYGKRVTDDLMKKTMQEAYARAEASARSMAEAAGQSLGPLVSLSRPGRGEEETTEVNDYVLRQALARAGGEARRPGVELMSPRLIPLVHRVSLLATFELKPR